MFISVAFFFSGEDDLQDVEIEKDDEDEDGDSYGEEIPSEGDMDDEGEGSDLPSEDLGNKKGKKKKDKPEPATGKKTKHGTLYASYEEFAHLLEDGLDDEIEKPKVKKHKLAGPNYAAQKRKRTK